MAHGTSYSFLYRVLRPDEDAARGLLAKDWYSDVSIKDHVSYGSRLSSKYISTCSSKEAAIDFAEIGLRHNDPPKTIVTIDARKLVTRTRARLVDLTDPEVRDQYLGRDKRANNFAQRTGEVIIIGRVPRWCIVNEFYIDEVSDDDFY